MKVWITKYAISKGMYEAEVEIDEKDQYKFAKVVSEKWSERILIHPRHWHKTREEAVAKVRKMIAARRAGIKKESAKLDALAASLRE